jgi:hypothetical protein
MDCSVDEIADYVSCYGSPIASKEEAERRFTGLIDELQAVLPSERWQGAETEPRTASIRSYTCRDQDSDAQIDIDIVPQWSPNEEISHVITIFGWTAIEPRLWALKIGFSDQLTWYFSAVTLTTPLRSLTLFAKRLRHHSNSLYQKVMTLVRADEKFQIDNVNLDSARLEISTTFHCFAARERKPSWFAGTRDVGSYYLGVCLNLDTICL